MRGTPTKMEVPPKLITENGNTFMRITGSASDKQSIPSSKPNKNRSTVQFTSSYSSMPVLSDSNRHQTYSAAIRYRDIPHNSGTNFELFQAQSGGPDGGYGTADGQGPVVIMWRRNDGHVIFAAYYANGTKWNTFERVLKSR